MANEVLIEAVNLSKAFGGLVAVDNVNLQVREHTIHAIIGPNGAGKTTTFYMMVGLVTPDEGRVLLDGKDITPSPMYVRGRMGLGYLPQEASVFRSLSVEDNLRLVLEERPMADRDRQELFDRLVEDLGIGRVLKVPGYALSGGERRRVEIARCLAVMPEFVLLDEPFSGIDPIAVYDIQQIILELRNKGFGILLTDHNVRDTLAITDRACLIHQGQVVVEGTPKEVAESDVARRFYLGDRFSW